MKRSHTVDWDVYWKGTRENAAHREGGPQEAALTRFWQPIFAQHLSGGRSLRLLDVASGNGAVTGHALAVGGQLESYCLDYSASALTELRKRHPASRCVAADAAHLPWKDGTFDLVVSQFGLEYAGPEALLEAGRVVAVGGVLAAVIHLRDGGIYRECEQNRRIIEAIEDTRVLPLARQAFAAGYALNRGELEPGQFREAERAFTPAVRGVEGVMQRYGREAADGLPQQLYRDIATMYQRMSAYEEADIMAWVAGMEAELRAYHGRMASMLEAALDAERLEELLQALAALGFDAIAPQQLVLGQAATPAAWTLVLRRLA